MNGSEHRMDGATFQKRFWLPFLAVFAISLVSIGLYLVVVVDQRSNDRAWSRYQYVFFETLAGREEGMRYREKDAQSSAIILREIPKERLDEDLKEMSLLRTSYQNGSVDTMQIMLTSGKNADPVKIERVLRYSQMVSSYSSFRKVVDDPETFTAIKRVLEGGPVPEIQGIDKSLWPSQKVWAIWFLSVQFVIFFVYALVYFGESAGSGPIYNPLLDVPKGVGSKLCLFVTVPGSLPLMLVILLLSAPSRIKARIGQGSAKAKRFASIEEGVFSSQSSRESLARLKKRAEGR